MTKCFGKEACLRHLRKALSLAESYGMLYTLATMQYYYTPNALEEALDGFPERFKEKVRKCNRDFHNCYVRFADAIQRNSIYKLLRGNYYIYVILAVRNRTYKQVSEIMGVSVGTVAKRYGEIYTRPGVTCKDKMVSLYRRLTGMPADKWLAGAGLFIRKSIKLFR